MRRPGAIRASCRVSLMLSTVRFLCLIHALLASRSTPRVQHGVDATSLAPSLGPVDHVIFNHPHLGLDDLHDEAAHAVVARVLGVRFVSSAM